MKFKLPVVVVLVASMLLSACGAPTPKEASTKEPAAQTQETKDGSQEVKAPESANNIDTSKFADVVWYSLGDVPTNGQIDKTKEKWDALLKEKVNASLTFKFIPWTDWSTQYNLKLASGESFDMINTATDWLSGWQNAQRGAFMPIDELLPKYAPITYGEIPQEHWDQCKYNGQIVFIPENSYTQWVNHGFMYRGDWAKEFGMTLPLNSWTQIGEYLQNIKDKKPDVIPYDVSGNIGVSTAIYSSFVISNTDSILSEPVSGSGLYFSKDYDNITETFSPIYDQVMVDFAVMMKDWADKGYWREDVLNYTGDTRALMKEGKTGMDEHHTQTYRGLRTEMDEKQPGSELQFFAFSMQGGKNLTEMTITHGAQSVAASSKNPERALMVYDLVRNDPEIYKLINYGVEGVQYEIKDGKRHQPEGYDETRDGFYTDFWGGRVDKNEIPSIRDYAQIGDVYAAYDKIKKPFAYPGFIWDQTPVASEVANVENVFNSQISAIAFGKVQDPQKAVEQLRTDLTNAGIDKVIAEINTQLAAWKAK